MRFTDFQVYISRSTNLLASAQKSLNIFIMKLTRLFGESVNKKFAMVITLTAFAKCFTPVVNFNNILRAAFAVISFCQKITKLKFKHRKGAQSTFAQKSCK